MKPHVLAKRIEGAERLEPIAERLSGLVHRAVPRGRVKDVLSGTPLGHPLHPLLTDLPIGAFTSVALLDLAGQPDAADTLLTVGLATVVPAAAAGLADWSETYGGPRRVGVVHAASNVAATALFAGSLILRRTGHRGAGRALSLLALGTMGAGGYLGGHLSFARGVGVNHALEEGPSEWKAAVPVAQLADTNSVVVEVDGADILLARVGGDNGDTPDILAIAATCSHAGGPLGEGKLEGRCVQCPWHQSVFRLDDGEVVHGPASVPQPAYQTRISDGQVEVMRR